MGLDVYEEEQLFFQDLSQQVIGDDLFMRLTTFPNVLITGHQAFFTTEALTHIAETTLANISAFEQRSGTLHRVTVGRPVTYREPGKIPASCCVQDHFSNGFFR